MRFEVCFRVVNPEYNRDYAVEYHFGEDTPDNSKYVYQDKYRINGDVTEWKIIRSTVFNLEMIHSVDKTKANFEIEKMFVLELTTIDKLIKLGVSESLLIRTYEPNDIKHDICRFYFNIKDGIPFEKFGGVYIDHNYLPNELRG